MGNYHQAIEQVPLSPEDVALLEKRLKDSRAVHGKVVGGCLCFGLLGNFLMAPAGIGVVAFWSVLWAAIYLFYGHAFSTTRSLVQDLTAKSKLRIEGAILEKIELGEGQYAVRLASGRFPIGVTLFVRCAVGDRVELEQAAKSGVLLSARLLPLPLR